MLNTVFWLSLVLLLYVYLGYPLLVRFLSAFMRAPVRFDDGHRPFVSIVIAAYNEAADIAETLQNKLDQNYPSDLMEILVVSDESDDGTDEIVSQKAQAARCPIKLVRQVPRQAKPLD
ncbi:glycosyltransferase [Marinobacter similis]|uniref:glycosyltransferase n=1 Tax=Marinobacter similis TaxID=1420916 RepID=UPI001F261878|nr:glycosyltransferase [Marinobacter similis]